MSPRFALRSIPTPKTPSFAAEMFAALKVSGPARTAAIDAVNKKFGIRRPPATAPVASAVPSGAMPEAEYARRWRALKASPEWPRNQAEFSELQHQFRVSRCTDETSKTMAEAHRLGRDRRYLARFADFKKSREYQLARDEYATIDTPFVH